MLSHSKVLPSIAKLLLLRGMPAVSGSTPFISTRPAVPKYTEGRGKEARQLYGRTAAMQEMQPCS